MNVKLKNVLAAYCTLFLLVAQDDSWMIFSAATSERVLLEGIQAVKLSGKKTAFEMGKAGKED